MNLSQFIDTNVGSPGSWRQRWHFCCGSPHCVYIKHHAWCIHIIPVLRTCLGQPSYLGGSGLHWCRNRDSGDDGGHMGWRQRIRVSFVLISTYVNIFKSFLLQATSSTSPPDTTQVPRWLLPIAQPTSRMSKRVCHQFFTQDTVWSVNILAYHT